MIRYHEGFFGVSPDLLFRFKGSVVPKSLVWATPCTCAAVGLFFYWGGVDSSVSASVGQAWTGYSFVLGFLIVYRMVISYKRYWEAVGLVAKMKGEWLDSFHSICSFCSRDEARKEDVVTFKGLVVRLYSILHQTAMSNLCRAPADEIPIIDPVGIDEDCLDFLQRAPDRIDVVIPWLLQAVCEANRAGTVNAPAPVLSRFFNELSRGTINYCDVLKIRNYALPFPIVQMIQYLMVFHAVVTPTISSLTMYNWRWAGMLAFSSIFSMWCINYIAIEIEQPFGENFNNLPLRDMADEFNEALLLATDHQMDRPPEFNAKKAGRFSVKAAELDYEAVMQRTVGTAQNQDIDFAPCPEMPEFIPEYRPSGGDGGDGDEAQGSEAGNSL